VRPFTVMALESELVTHVANFKINKFESVSIVFPFVYVDSGCVRESQELHVTRNDMRSRRVLSGHLQATGC
jgi:hypothetical protein